MAQVVRHRVLVLARRADKAARRIARGREVHRGARTAARARIFCGIRVEGAGGARLLRLAVALPWAVLAGVPSPGARREQPRPLSFDATLGFPGEGPRTKSTARSSAYRAARQNIIDFQPETSLLAEETAKEKEDERKKKAIE